MTFPIRADLYTFNGFVPTTEILREEWGPSGDLEDLRRSFAGATGDVLELIDRMTSALITPIYFRDPLPVWGTERIVLVGDAAHPTPPSAAQGAGQALEDSVTLAACLRRADGQDGVPAALAEFAARRQARTAGMLTAARINFGDVQRARSGADAGPGRAPAGHAPHGSGRRDDVRLALRPRRDRGRRGAAAAARWHGRRSWSARSHSGRSSCGETRSRRRTARGCGSASGRDMRASCSGPARHRRR